MEQKAEDRGVQVRCPFCGKKIPVQVKELTGKLTISIRCPGCKRVGEITLQDIR